MSTRRMYGGGKRMKYIHNRSSQIHKYKIYSYNMHVMFNNNNIYINTYKYNIHPPLNEYNLENLLENSTMTNN